MVHGAETGAPLQDDNMDGLNPPLPEDYQPADAGELGRQAEAQAAEVLQGLGSAAVVEPFGYKLAEPLPDSGTLDKGKEFTNATQVLTKTKEGDAWEEDPNDW